MVTLSTSADWVAADESLWWPGQAPRAARQRRRILRRSSRVTPSSQRKPSAAPGLPTSSSWTPAVVFRHGANRNPKTDPTEREHPRFLMNYEEAPHAQLPTAGLSANYVARETKRVIADVNGEIAVYPGIDVGVPGQGRREADYAGRCSDCRQNRLRGRRARRGPLAQILGKEALQPRGRGCARGGSALAGAWEGAQTTRGRAAGTAR